MDDPISDFKEWYLTRPPITRAFLTSSALIALLVTTDFVSIIKLYYTFSDTVYTFELWRPITSLLFLGNVSLYFICKAYFAYFALVYAERDLFQRSRLADFIALLFYIFGLMILGASFINLYFIADGFLFAIIYIWCKTKPFQVINFMMGITLTSGYFPWVYLGFNVLMGESFINLVLGFIIGWLYLYLKGPFLHKYHIDLMPTPSLLKSLTKIYLSWEESRRPRNMQQDEDDLYT